MQIVPMRDLKDTVKIENMCVMNKEPIFVTKNGYGKLVVMDMECFERLMSQAYEAKLIREGLADLEAGKIIDGKTALDELKQKYGF